MAEYLPNIYLQFLERFPEVADAQGALARAVRDRNTFDDRTDRLIKLALAVGAEAEGAVRDVQARGAWIAGGDTVGPA